MRISKKWKFILRQSKIIFIPVKKATAVNCGGFFIVIVIPNPPKAVEESLRISHFVMK